MREEVTLNSKLNDGLSPRRVQYVHAVLRSALGRAEKWGIIARNVAKLADIPKVEQPEINPFDPSEARLFVKAIAGERLEALYLLAIATGGGIRLVMGGYRFRKEPMHCAEDPAAH